MSTGEAGNAVLLPGGVSRDVRRALGRALDGGDVPVADALVLAEARGRDLSALTVVADVLIQDLGRAPGQRAEAGRAQLRQVFLDRQARAHGAVEHLLRRERVQVEVREPALDRAREVDVVATLELRWQPRLDAHLGRAEIAGLARAPHDLRDGQEVPLLLAMVAAERAEAAVLDADVREVDVAVDDERHRVADLPPPQLVGGERQRLEVAAGGAREEVALGDRHLGAVERPGEDVTHGSRDPVQRGVQATSVASAHACP